VISIGNLKFRYSDGKEIFKNLNFLLNNKEKVGLTGPNGAGKTTLFHLIMGLLKPESGKIEIFGKVRREEKDYVEVRRKIGLLFQDSDDQLFCPTVEEDIAFGPLNIGKSHEEVHTIVNDICEKLGLKGFEKKITQRLSGGEKRLVALGTVMAMYPECYLLDEPVAGLDEQTTERFLNYMREHAETYIIIAHDRNFLKRSVNKIYELRDGNIKLL
jgi:cobalt/nickel transport system ATP-binding protein